MKSKRHPSIKKTLLEKMPAIEGDRVYLNQLKTLQETIFRAQRSLFHQKKRAIIVFEGLDAAGKGGSIRRITELLDPRGFQVHPIGAPDLKDQSKHWLYRFWQKLPEPGSIAIFDRSWYGRVLVENVELGLSKARVQEAYQTINEFERALSSDGIIVIKIFLAISKDEQLRRFEQRLSDPFKQWKLQSSDIETRRHFNDYLNAIDEMFKKTDSQYAPWQLVPCDDKHFTRIQVLKIVSDRLNSEVKGNDEQTLSKKEIKKIKAALRLLK
jgi:AMP-polyphosphate phosphotransferase